MDPQTSGRAARQLETLHAMCYFVPEVEAELVGLGMRSGRASYFAQRSAAMGRVGAGPVVASFFVFNPALVSKLVPACWESVEPEAVVAARLRAVDAAYHRLLGAEALTDPGLAEAADLIREAVTACDPAGRALYAAHSDLDWPEPPHLALWHGLTLLREYRGDGHVAALLAAGLTGIEALVSHTVTGTGFTVPAAQLTRAWSEEQWAAACASLSDRGLLDDAGALTAEGEALRISVERATDELAAAPWDVIGEAGVKRLKEVGMPLVKTMLAGGVFPAGVFS
ncbi:MAG: hypothetical protein WB471_07350 [Nocardioides sp.]